MGTQDGETSQQNRGRIVTKITMQSLIFLYGISDKNDIKHNVEVVHDDKPKGYTPLDILYFCKNLSIYEFKKYLFNP
jgi:hypothetical protein